MKVWIPLFLAVLFLSGCGGKQAAETREAAYRQVDMTEAMAIMEQESDFCILDVRREDEYRQGHIPGAINIPNEAIGTEEPSQLPDKAQTILVYCRSGNRNKQAAEKLAKLGYTNIVEFGGIVDWPGPTEAP